MFRSLRVMVVSCLMFSAPTFADVNVTCTYKFMNVEFATLTITLHDDGTPATMVSVTHQGSTRQETATGDIIQPDQFAHYWIAKQSPENDIEVIIYKKNQGPGISKMVNRHAPMGDTMWAETCSGLPNL